MNLSDTNTHFIGANAGDCRRSVSADVDINGDGLADILIGAPGRYIE